MEVELTKEEEIERLVESLKGSKASDWEFHDKFSPVYSTGKGLNKSVVEEISEIKKEPDWMRRMRLKALEIFQSKPMPTWGPDPPLHTAPLSAANLLSVNGTALQK